MCIFKFLKMNFRMKAKFKSLPSQKVCKFNNKKNSIASPNTKKSHQVKVNSYPFSLVHFEPLNGERKVGFISSAPIKTNLTLHLQPMFCPTEKFNVSHQKA